MSDTDPQKKKKENRKIRSGNVDSSEKSLAKQMKFSSENVLNCLKVVKMMLCLTSLSI